MIDKKKVCKGLYAHGYKDCRLCPYWGSGPYDSSECRELAREALSLLREQEPRVITRWELKQFEGSPCWFESSSTYMGKNGFWIIPAKLRSFFAGTFMPYISVLDGMTDCGELGLSAYNKTWRCWTARPTDEQMEAVKWDD